MRKVKRNPFLSGVATILGGVLLVAGVASAQEAPMQQTVGSDKAGAILVFPKLVFNSIDLTRPAVDSLIQISNTAPHQIRVRCFLVNTNGHCSNAGASGGGFTAPLVCDAHGGTVVLNSPECNGGTVTGGSCIGGWQETDFSFILTGRQPIVWKLSDGLSFFPLDGLINVGPVDNDPAAGQYRGQPAYNRDSHIPGAPENPFVGEMKCVQVDIDSELPTEGTDSDNNYAGDLKGEVTIVEPRAASLDVRSYNAIGIQAKVDSNDNSNTLVLGQNQEYAACPGTLILNHFFDDAVEPVNFDRVRTALTLVPCSEDFDLQKPASTVVQMLVYNEFEQRFSTSRKLTCFASWPLSDIDTRSGPTGDATSIFNVGVQGTLTGQTRLRGVDSGDPSRGDGLLAVAEEFHYYPIPAAYFSAAFNVQQPVRSWRGTNDIIVLPALP